MEWNGGCIDANRNDQILVGIGISLAKDIVKMDIRMKARSRLWNVEMKTLDEIYTLHFLHVTQIISVRKSFDS